MFIISLSRVHLPLKPRISPLILEFHSLLYSCELMRSVTIAYVLLSTLACFRKSGCERGQSDIRRNKKQLTAVHAFFNKDFSEFLHRNYGSKFNDFLQRSDLGTIGSFGGKENESVVLERDPVIFVHGVSDVAGIKMKALADKYKELGYTAAELYSTTYAYGAQGNPLQWTLYSMRCEYIKQIRALILAVRLYARENVDIVAFSLGVPMTRKAILGGRCVDTKENLGGPLTRYVDTFVGISGPNHGMTFKVAGVPVPACALGTLPICDKVIGLYSGLCPLESEFLNDINEKHHYEGHKVYSIYSHADEKIGYKVCDKVTSSIDGEDGHKSFRNLLHDDTLNTTYELQILMIQGRFKSRYEELQSVDRNIDMVRKEQRQHVRNNHTSALGYSKEFLSGEFPVDDRSLPNTEFGKKSTDFSRKRNTHNFPGLIRGREGKSLNLDRINSLSSNELQHNDKKPVHYRSTAMEYYKVRSVNIAKEDGYHTRISFGLQ